MIVVRNKKTFHKSDFKGKTIYIGRGSPFGNPYKMKNNSLEERKRVIDKFKIMFYSEMGKPLRDMAKGIALKYDNIALTCWCHPLPCHGDVIKQYIDETVERIDLSHCFTSHPICPYCGYEQDDSYEFEDYNEVECENCEEIFFLEVHSEITYSTKKKEED